MSQTQPHLPENALVVLIGASGAGKSTLARTWPASQVLSLDALRGTVGDDPGDQAATADAADVLKLILERRMARRLNTVVDATNVEEAIRVGLVMTAKKYGVPTVAVVVSTPLSLCLQRQHPRPANRRVPDDVVRRQHEAMTFSHQNLTREGFNQVLFAHDLNRLEPYLRDLSEARQADLGLDGGDGLGHLLLVRRFFGEDIVPMWRWKDGSDIAGGDRVGEIRLGQQVLTLALRLDVDGEGDIGFDVRVPCPFEPGCGAAAWTPAYSVTCLRRALTGDLDHRDDIVCDVHGGYDDVDQEADDHAAGMDDDADGRADLEEQYAAEVRE
ncbi:ATP-binding protein [Streptomyces sp. TX20-6-3]|uniref:ATP-binding protein n=1 Tax=Streptomyces sp. TX20-6-3 TaxID=3028705 RepID=UPI0029ABFC85|nr:ATP-binding protein [Streptomyces sp. TX20-6-3]MDX2565022.1 ATP-binding protein [Streptomyces sp. TX20-6-3]